MSDAPWKCDWSPDDLNPLEDGCPYCADRMCARFDGLNCTHDRIERHGYPAMSDETRTVTVESLAAGMDNAWMRPNHEFNVVMARAIFAALPVATAGPEPPVERLADILRDTFEDDIGEMADELWLADARAIAAALRGAAAQADGGEPGLTEAWAAAVAVLPEGVGLELAKLALDDWAEAVAGDITEQGATPVAALLALAARLTDPNP